MNKVKVIVVSLMFFALTGCEEKILKAVIGESQEILMVKKGTMNSCPNYTVEQLVNNFMDKPKWEHIVADNDIDYVNISGIISVNDRPAKGLLQLWLNNDIFGFQAFEIDGEPQNDFMASILIDEMCKAANN